MSTSPLQATQTAAGFPLRMGSPDAFARTRTFLQEAGYEDTSVCRALGIEVMSDIGDVRWSKLPLETFPARLHWCLDTFLRTATTPVAFARGICGDATLAALTELGLLRPAKYEADSLVCPVWLYPVDGFVVASDLKSDPDGDPYVEPADIVFPAIDVGTIRFLRIMPDAHGGDALDLCGGCGIGALHQSRTARTALSSDLTPRSAMYTTFNIALNGTAAASLCGDLYQPVQGRQFDAITAHPPYVPASGETLVYRDAGDTGEDVTRRVVEGLPTYLRAGGTAMILCAGNDTVAETFEQRARAWLGRAAPEFEIIFGQQRTITLESVVESARRRESQPINEREAAELRARLDAQETRQLVYGALMLHRHHQPVAVEPFRVPMAITAHLDDFTRLFAWRQQARRADFSQWLAASHPRLSSRLECNARYIVDGGQLVSDEFTFNTRGGIPWTLRGEAWMVSLFSGIDGRRTVAEIYQAAHAADGLPDGYDMQKFAGMMTLMIERGFLDVDLA